MNAAAFNATSGRNASMVIPPLARNHNCFSNSVWIRCFASKSGGNQRMPHVVTKADLVQAAAKAGNLSKAAAGEAVNAVFDAIVENVAKGKRVTVVGFGTFLPRKRKARAGRSPVNGKEIKIDAKTLPAFAAGQGFKQAVEKTD
jgi:DNA-binding protein HU-beta